MLGPGDEREVDLAATDRADQLRGRVLAQPQLEPRMRRADLGEGVVEPRPREPEHGADAEGSEQQPAQVGRRGADLPDRLEGGADRGHQTLALLGEGDPAGGAVEQGDAELALELLHLRAHPGLADAHAFGGRREGSRLDDGQDVAQLVKFHL